nr:hypothetical protein [Tanacetum cinerariifolium]
MMGHVGPTTVSSTPNPNHPTCRDTVQLETAVSTISQEYLLEFMYEYGISEALHPELPGPGERIVDFPEGKDGAAKVSHFEINCRVLNIVPTLSSFRVFYIPSFNSWCMSFSKRPGKNTPQCYTKPLDSLKNWNHRFFWVDERIFPTVVKTGTRPRAAHEVPLLTVTTSRVIEMEDPTAKTDSSRVPSTIEMLPLDFANENRSQQSTGGNRPEDQGQEAVAPEVPPPENVMTTRVAPEAGQAEGIDATGPHVIKERRKRGNDGVDTNAPPKVLRRDHADSRLTQSTHE